MILPKTYTLHLMVAPDQAAQAAEYGLSLAHMAYRVGSGPHLFRAKSSTTYPRNGVMVLDCQGFDGRGSSEPLCWEVMQECVARNFSGVFCDFEGPFPPLLQRSAETLASLLHRRHGVLYLPEECAATCPQGSKVVISSAISGGSLRQRLEEAADRFGGPDRLALGLERVAEDFTLPAKTGAGAPLTWEVLQKLMSDRSPAVYFSDELCAHYFTYMRTGGAAHFVLFDDAASIARKLRVAADLGIREGFLPYAGNADLLG